MCPDRPWEGRSPRGGSGARVAASTPERIIFICANVCRLPLRGARGPLRTRIAAHPQARRRRLAQCRDHGRRASLHKVVHCICARVPTPSYSQEAFPAVRGASDAMTGSGLTAAPPAPAHPGGISIRPQERIRHETHQPARRGACRRLDLRPGRRLGAGSPRHRRAHGAAAAPGGNGARPRAGAQLGGRPLGLARRRVRLGAGALGDRPPQHGVGAGPLGAARWRVGLGGRPLAPPRQRLRLALARRRSRRRANYHDPFPRDPTRS